MKEDSELIDNQDTTPNEVTTTNKKKQGNKFKYSRTVICVFIIVLLNAILKYLIAYNITMFIVRNFSFLYTYCLKFFPNKDLFVFLYYINYLFLAFGIVALFSEPILQIYIRGNFIVSDNRRLLYLICGKLMYFVVLGMVPESTLLMFKFNNKNNVIIPLFIIKIYFQPILLIGVVIYGLFVLLSFKGKEIMINLRKLLLIYLGVIKTISKVSFFNWKQIKETDQENNEEEDEDEEEEDNEDLIPVKSKYLRAGAFLMFLALLFSPVLNGLFGYGFFVFFFTQDLTCLLFKLDIVMSVIFTLLTLKIIA